jgi:Holliday junction resolvase
MKTEIYLNKEDLEGILEFMTSFDKETVLISYDNSSGIGAIITASISGIIMNKQVVTISKSIANESSW